jgi:hypothetical protein
MKAYGGVEVQTHVFLTSALVGRKWSASRPAHFNPGERAPGIHWIEVGLGLRVSLGIELLRKDSGYPGLQT